MIFRVGQPLGSSPDEHLANALTAPDTGYRGRFDTKPFDPILQAAKQVEESVRFRTFACGTEKSLSG